ncbi:MAG: exodeoxyribonuclease III [Patescibacteria group bacterium]
MKIICWNVNGIRAWSKKGSFDWVLSQKPDIFCLQETKAHPEQLTADILSPKGYVSYFDHARTRKGYSGVAVYTKTAPNKIDYALGVSELDQEGRFLALYFDTFVLINCYFPNGGGAPERLAYKLAYYEAFLKYAEKCRKKGFEIVFCGDVNVAHNEIDIARPKENMNHVGFLPVERAWVDRVISKGYVDVFRHFNPDRAAAYTWWDMKSYARDRNIGWRIDYFFISPVLLPKVIDIKIHADIFGSDHCPIELVIDLKK